MNLTSIPSDLPKALASFAITEAASIMLAAGHHYIKRLKVAIKPKGKKKARHLICFEFQKNGSSYNVFNISHRYAKKGEFFLPSKEDKTLLVVEVEDWTQPAAPAATPQAEISQEPAQ